MIASSSAPRSRTFELDGHTLTLRTDDDRRWTVLLDGKPVAMRMRRTASVLGNTGTKEQVLEDWHSVETAELGPFAQGEPFQRVNADGSRSMAVFGIGMNSGAVHNTVVYVSRSVTIVFAFDGRPVDVTENEHSDVST